MKVLMANFPWIGGIASYLEKAFGDLGHEVKQVLYVERLTPYIRLLKLNQLKYISRMTLERERRLHNLSILRIAKEFRPDLFLVLNEGYVDAETVSILKRDHGTFNVCLIADDPFDSYRFHELPYSLRFFDHIYVAEKLWINKIKMVSSSAKVFKFLSAYDHNMFTIEKANRLKGGGFEHLGCDVSFTGESYGRRAEGAYRSGILSSLVRYKLRFWGDDGWKYQLRFYPGLTNSYSGTRLTFDELVYLYANSPINLNMPSPQLTTAFQPRVFEIPACGGFQIVDHREDLFEVFKEDEIVTFRSIPELVEKVEYFLKNPEKRKPYIAAGLRAIQGNSWKDRAMSIIDNLEAVI